MEKWKKVRTKETVHFGKYYHVQVDEVITPGGKPSTYSVVRLHPFSVIVPMDSEGRIHLVRQHRYATDTVTLEFPTGGTEGQDPLVAAKRELEEEASLESDDWIGLGKIQEVNGIAEAIGYLYLARNVRSVLNPLVDPADQDMIDALSVTVEEGKRMIANGEIEDSPTICAFARADLLGLLKK